MQQILLNSIAVGGPVVALTNKSIAASRTGAGLTVATFKTDNTGVASGGVTPGGTGAGSYAPQWLSGGGTPSNYDVRWTVVSGTLTTGTTGTWLNLGTTRNWTINAGAGIGTKTAVGTVEIRDVGTLAVLATATITISA